MALLALKVTTAVTPAGGSAAATTSVKSAAVSVAAPITFTLGLPPTVVSTTSPKFATVILTPSGGDDSAIAAGYIAAGGTILLGPGTFLWNTMVPAFKRSTPTRVVGAGVGKTFIKLSSGAPRAFDFNKVADYDTFNDIDISDLTIDVNNVGGQHHNVLGTYAGGVQTTKINLARISLCRIRTINVPTDPTAVNHRLNVWMYVQVNAADTACTMNDLVLEDLDFMQGGNIGVGLGGTTNDGTGYGNLTHDRVYLTRVNHDTKLTCPNTTVNGAAQTLSTTPSTLTVASTTNFPAAGTIVVATSTTPATVTYTGITGTTFTGCTVASGSFTATNGGNATCFTWSSYAIQIGSRDLGLTVTLRDCHSFNSGDVGIALLNTRHGQAFGCTSTDARNLNLQAANFNPNLPTDQTHAFYSCHAKIINLRPDGLTHSGAGFGGSGGAQGQLGHMLMEGCTIDSLSPNLGTLGQAIQVSALPIAKLTVRDCTYTQRAVNWTMTATSSPVGGLYFNPIAGLGIPSILTIDNFKTDVAGAVTRGGFTFNYRDVFINPGPNCEVELACISHRPAYSMTGVANATYTACLIGPAAAPSTTTVTANTSNVSSALANITPAYGIGRGNFLTSAGNLSANTGVYSVGTNGTAAVMTSNGSAVTTGATITVTPFAVIYGYWKTIAGVFDGSDGTPNGITVNLAGAIGGAIVGSQCFSIPPMQGLHLDGSDFGKYPAASGQPSGGNPNLEFQVGTTNTSGAMPLVTWNAVKMAGNRISEDANSFSLANGATTIPNQTGRRVNIYCSVAVTVLTITRRTSGTPISVAPTPFFVLEPGDQAVATTAGGLYYRFPAET